MGEAGLLQDAAEPLRWSLSPFPLAPEGRAPVWDICQRVQCLLEVLTGERQDQGGDQPGRRTQGELFFLPLFLLWRGTVGAAIKVPSAGCQKPSKVSGNEVLYGYLKQQCRWSCGLCWQLLQLFFLFSSIFLKLLEPGCWCCCCCWWWWWYCNGSNSDADAGGGGDDDSGHGGDDEDGHGGDEDGHGGDDGGCGGNDDDGGGGDDGDDDDDSVGHGDDDDWCCWLWWSCRHCMLGRTWTTCNGTQCTSSGVAMRWRCGWMTRSTQEVNFTYNVSCLHYDPVKCGGFTF